MDAGCSAALYGFAGSSLLLKAYKDAPLLFEVAGSSAIHRARWAIGSGRALR